MIRTGNRVVSATGSKDYRCGLSASMCALAQRTKARGLQIDHLWRRSRVFPRMRKTLLSTPYRHSILVSVQESAAVWQDVIVRCTSMPIQAVQQIHRMRGGPHSHLIRCVDEISSDKRWNSRGVLSNVFLILGKTRERRHKWSICSSRAFVR